MAGAVKLTEGVVIPPMTTAIIETVEKKRRVHPNSLANLKPFPKGVSGNPGKPHVGPMITPALRRYAEWPLEKLEGLDIEKLPVHEAIAVTYLLDAISTGSFSTGAKSRDAVTQRLDGEPAKGISVDVNVTTFTLSFNGNNDQRD